MSIDSNHPLLASLNSPQKEAAMDFSNPLLVLAGAGSGKTKMLTTKMALGIEQGLFGPQSFLAVTFTNKAAAEMRSRIAQMLRGHDISRSWITTFHSMGNRLLRTYAPRLGYNSDFTILDSSDQVSVVKGLLKNLRFDNSSVNARKVAREIQAFKSDLQAQKNPESHFFTPMTKAVYPNYASELKKLNAFDFSDLLLQTYFLLKRNPDVAEELQQQFKYILVDEYQDTNLLQYEILKSLSYNKKNICAVGDEDQSIYSWRGAHIFNILNFDKDFPGARIIKLEQNYRSTKTIIGAATAVIANNTQRKGKTLFTENPQGGLIEVLESPTEYDEALAIAYSIQKKTQKKECQFSDIAIFYRTNAQSRVLEEKLRNFSIPYTIYGGLKFYDRKEIKDINAYMRLVVNPKDDVSFRRVINSPARGLGKSTVDKIDAYALSQSLSLVEATIQMVEDKIFPNRTAIKLQGFLDLITVLRERCLEVELSEFYQDLLDKTGYIKSLEDEDTIEAQSRIQNLEEFGNAIARYLELNPNEKHITQFLHHMALVSDSESKEDDGQSVTLMTLHIAKGLEFPVVYIAGLEEGLFPHTGAGDENDPADMELEEERRLFYVGMTRAEEDLTLSFARQRKVWGQNQYQAPSRFLKELPEQYLKNKIPSSTSRFVQNYGSSQESQSTFNSTHFSTKKSNDPFPDYESGDSEQNHSPYRKGRRVYHPHFGTGVIHLVEGEGAKEKVSVLFDDRTYKKFLSQYAHLEFND